MRILHVTPYMHPNAGGPPIVVHRLAEELQNRGYQSPVVTTDSYADEDQTWQQQFNNLRELHVAKSRGRGAFSYSRELKPLLKRMIASSNLVQIHTLWTYPGLLAARLAKKSQTPYFVMPHGMLDPNSLGRKALKKRLVGKLVQFPLLRHATGMIYTHQEEQRLALQGDPKLPRGFIVPLGADTPPSEPQDSLARHFLHRFPQLVEKRLVLFLSRLHSKKGLDLLVPAFSRVVESVPEAHLVLVGPTEDSYRREIESWIARDQLTQHVTLTGPLYDRDKWSAMAASELFALSSYQENFALVVVDALQMGLPVVLSRRVNIWEDVVESGAGLACDLNTTSVASTIIKAMTDNVFRQQASTAGPELVQSRFTWTHAGDKLMKAYESIASPVHPSA